MGHKYHYSWKYFLDWTHMLFQKSKQRSEYFYEAKTNKSIFEHSFPPIVLQKMLKESVWQFLPHSFLPTLICFTISLASYNNYNIKTTTHLPDQQYSIWYENFKGSSTCINWISFTFYALVLVYMSKKNCVSEQLQFVNNGFFWHWFLSLLYIWKILN